MSEPHRCYVGTTHMPGIMNEVYQATCVTCRWEGPKRYDKWAAKDQAERDRAEHIADPNATADGGIIESLGKVRAIMGPTMAAGQAQGIVGEVIPSAPQTEE